MPLVAITTVLLLSLWPALTPHKFPDGYVDRAIEVVVRDRIIQIEYSVGMNDVTMRDFIARWQADELKHELPLRSPTMRSNKRQTQEGFSLTDSLISRAVTPVFREKNQTSPADHEEFRNEAQLAAEFRKLAVDRIAENLAVVCTGVDLKIKRATGTIPTRRHMSLTVAFELTLPENPSVVDLTITDRNFEEMNGGIRLALKATGSALLAKSNVAPILVRSEKLELADLDVPGRQRASTIVSKIIQH